MNGAVRERAEIDFCDLRLHSSVVFCAPKRLVLSIRRTAVPLPSRLAVILLLSPRNGYHTYTLQIAFTVFCSY